MSRYPVKYPGLFAGAKAAGISYHTALNRVKLSGWSVARAISTPVGRRGRRAGVATLADSEAKYNELLKAKDPMLVPAPARTLPWERPNYVVREPSRVMRCGRTIAPHYDTAPPRIQKIRALYCDRFIKTGGLDEALGQQLRDYADEQRAIQKHPVRVPDEHKAQSYSREDDRDRNDGRGDALQIDGAAAERIADFLRP